jgi:cytochrome c oxidase subunit 2
MKNIYLILILFVLLIFSACSNNLDEEHLHDDSHPHEEMMNNNIVVREVSIQAKAWDFIVDNGESQSLNEIRVKKGETVNLKAQSLDIGHGIGIPEYGVNIQFDPNNEAETSFVANKVGESEYFCTVYCGQGHRNHKGKIIVEE